MITKNENYGVNKNVTIAKFGKGDIIVTEGYLPDDNTISCVFMRNDIEKEIGISHPENKGKSTDELGVDIIMFFDNPKSIDVVIEMLQKAKDRLLPELLPKSAPFNRGECIKNYCEHPIACTTADGCCGTLTLPH